MKKRLAGFVGLIVFFLICLYFYTPVNFNDIKYVKIAGQHVRVGLAITPEEQSQGLSTRVVLAEDEGMLFVFSKSGNYSFWMKDMNFPIDIVWIGPDLKIVYIKKDARPESYPETYGPDSVGARYVLEVVSGFADKYNLKEGDEVEFY